MVNPKLRQRPVSPRNTALQLGIAVGQGQNCHFFKIKLRRRRRSRSRSAHGFPPMDNVIMKHQIHLIGQKHCHIWFKLLSLLVAELLVLQPWLTPIFGTFEPPEMSIQWLKTAISFNQMTIDSVNPPNLGYPNGSSACLQVFSHLLLLFHFF